MLLKISIKLSENHIITYEHVHDKFKNETEIKHDDTRYHLTLKILINNMIYRFLQMMLYIISEK